ncbi:MAG: CorA family divalent cation transporter [Alphaproteobacteria bacterium]
MTNKNQNPILFSYSFDGKGLAKILDKEQVAIELKSPDLSWVHIDGSAKNCAKWIQNEVNYLDNIIIDALIAEETRPRILKFEKGILLILRGVNLAKNSAKYDMVSIRMWIDSERIISIAKRPMKSLYDLEQKIVNGLKINSSGDFLANFLSENLQNISDHIYHAGDKIDEIEETVLTTRNMKFRDVIVKTRSELTISRRYLTPQREAIAGLLTIKFDWTSANILRHFQEKHEQINHIIEEADEVLIRSKILNDELSHALNEKINRNMYRLSAIAIIFMPLTFITSLFGMNFINIPFAQDPDGFMIVCVFMAVMTLVQLFFFKRKDWF